MSPTGSWSSRTREEELLKPSTLLLKIMETSGESLPPSGFARAVDDRLSTLSIDVDTASWTRVRRQLASGLLPEPGMVRVEEFVNYFPYDYQPPAEVRQFEAHVLGAPAPWNPERTLLRVGLQGYRVSVFDRKPAHLTFVVDVSGSMQGSDRLELVKDALHGLTVALVTYASDSRIVLRPTPALERATIHAAIDDLSAGGGTGMADRLFTAYELAASVAHPDTIDRVIVASDGDANIGPRNHAQITPTIRQYAKRGITLTTLGVGMGDYRDQNMEQLANDGDGNHFYLDSRAEARRVPVGRLTSTRSPSAVSPTTRSPRPRASPCGSSRSTAGATASRASANGPRPRPKPRRLPHLPPSRGPWWPGASCSRTGRAGSPSGPP